MTPENRISVTKAAKVAARDLLRLMKVNEHLSHVSAAQNRINEENKLYEEETARATKRIDVIEFEANAVPADHPAKDEKMEAAAKAREEHDLMMADRAKYHEDTMALLTKTLEERQARLDEWANGEVKVSKDDLHVETEKLLRQYVSDNFDGTVTDEE